MLFLASPLSNYIHGQVINVTGGQFGGMYLAELMGAVVGQARPGSGSSCPRVFAAPPGVEFRFELVRVSGGTAYVSGHGPLDGSEVLMQGKVGADLTAEQGNEAARLTALSMLASLQDGWATSTA